MAWSTDSGGVDLHARVPRLVLQLGPAERVRDIVPLPVRLVALALDHSARLPVAAARLHALPARRPLPAPHFPPARGTARWQRMRASWTANRFLHADLSALRILLRRLLWRWHGHRLPERTDGSSRALPPKKRSSTSAPAAFLWARLSTNSIRLRRGRQPSQ